MRTCGLRAGLLRGLGCLALALSLSVCTLAGDPGPASWAATGVTTALPVQVVADGTSAAQVLVRLQDAAGAPVARQKVTLTPSLAGAQVRPASGSTDANGQFAATLTATAAGVCTVQATLISYNGDLPLPNVPKVTFVAAPAPRPKPATGDGNGTPQAAALVVRLFTSQATANLTDTLGVAVTGGTAGASIRLQSLAANDVLQPEQGVLDGNGAFAASWRSSLAGSRRLTVATGTETASVLGLFVAGPPVASQSTFTFLSGGAVADGTGDSAVQVVLRDAYGNAVGNAAVQFSASGNATVIPGVGSTDANGLFIAHVTSTDVGNVTVTTQAANLPPAQLSTTFAPGPPLAGSSELLPANALATANGQQAVVLTLTARDAQQHLLGGQTVQFGVAGASAANATFVPSQATTDAAGRANVRLQASQAGNLTVSATFGGVTLTQQVAFVAPPAVVADAAHASWTVAPNCVVADGNAAATFTLLLGDANGQPVAGQAVQLTPLRGDDTLAPTSGETDANGTLQALLRATVAGTGGVTAQAGNLTLQQNVAFVAGPPADAQSSFVNLSGATVADGDSNAILRVLLRDAAGNVASGVAVAFVADGNATVLPATGVTDANGALAARVSATDVGDVNVTLQVANLSPLQVTASFVAGPPSAGSSDLLPANALATADGQQAVVLTLTARDAQQHLLGGQTVQFGVAGASAANATFVPSQATTDAAGRANVRLQASQAGNLTVSATFGGVTLTQQVAFVAPPAVVADAAHASWTVAPNRVVADGNAAATFTLLLGDANGQPVAGQAVQLTSLRGDDTLAPTSGETDANGTLQALLRATVAGTGGVTAQAGNLTLQQNVAFVAGPVSGTQSLFSAAPPSLPVSDQNATTLQLLARDASNNPVANVNVTLLAAGVQLHLGSTTGETDAAGSWQTTFSSTRAQAATVQATLDGNVSLSANVTFTPASPNQTLSSFVTSPNAPTANGVAQATLAATLMDAWSNPVPNQNVTFGADGNGNLLTGPNQVTDASGLAVAQLKSTVAENKAVTATSAGFVQSSMVPFVPGPVDANHASLVATPNAVAVDGNQVPTLALATRDAYNNIVGNVAFTLYASGAHNTFGQPAGVTNATGQFQTTLMSNFAQSESVWAALSGSGNVTTTVNFLAGAANATLTTFTASPNSVAADSSGTSASLSVLVKDKYGNPVGNQTVGFTASGGNNVLSAPSCVTSAAGSCQVTFSSSQVQTETWTANFGSFTKTQSVTITTGAASAATSTFVMNTNNNLPANGFNGISATLKILDAYGNPWPATPVHFTTTSNRAQLDVYDGTLNSQGAFNVALRTATAQTAAVTARALGLQLTVQGNYIAQGLAAGGTQVGVLPQALAVDGSSVGTVVVLSGDATGNPLASKAVSLSLAGNASLGATSGTTDGNGLFTTTVTGTAPGVTTLQANVAGVTVQTSLQLYAPGPATALLLYGLYGGPAPAQSKAWVRALDGNGNVATGYRGTVSFAASDANASLPTNYTFTAADAGEHAFAGVTLQSVGTQSVTVTDVGNAALTGQQAGLVVGPVDYGYYVIRALNLTNQCLDTVTQDGTTGAGINSNFIAGSYSQVMALGTDATVRVGTNCWAPQNGLVQAGSPLVLANCSGQVNQRWQLVQNLLRSLADPRLCVASQRGNTTGALLQPCNALAPAQQFVLQQQSPLFNFFQGDGQPYGWNLASMSSPLQINWVNGGSKQSFWWDAAGNLRNQDLCLNFSSTDLTTNPTLALASCSNLPGQQWLRQGATIRPATDANYCLTSDTGQNANVAAKTCYGNNMQNVAMTAAGSWRQLLPAAQAANDWCLAADANLPLGSNATLQPCAGPNTNFFLPPATDLTAPSNTAYMHLFLLGAGNTTLAMNPNGASSASIATAAFSGDRSQAFTLNTRNGAQTGLYTQDNTTTHYLDVGTSPTLGSTIKAVANFSSITSAWYVRARGWRLQATSAPSLCLEVQDAAPVNNTPIRFVPCANGTPGQQWSFLPTLISPTANEKSFAMQFGSRCMTARDTPATQPNFVLADCHFNGGDTTTLWTLAGGNTLVYRANPAYCLDANAPQAGSMPILAPCSGATTQQFTLY